jgi:hypothetical protein
VTSAPSAGGRGGGGAPAPRDTQRARLYRAEDEVAVGRSLPTLERLQAYVEEVRAAAWFVARWGERSFEVRPGFGHRHATADRDGRLQLPRWSRTELVVLHEMAHPLTPAGYAPHGPEFAGCCSLSSGGGWARAPPRDSRTPSPAIASAGRPPPFRPPSAPRPS